MPAKLYHVSLTTDEPSRLQHLLNSGTAAARTLTHARILLKADEGPGGPRWGDAAIAVAVEVSVPTVARVHTRCVTAGVDAALDRRPPCATTPRTLDGAQEAHLIALACSTPPEGHARWTLRLLAGRFVTLDCGVPVSHELVRRTLKKRAQAVVEAALVHPAASECRLRLADGRYSRCLSASLRPAFPPSLSG